MPKVLVTGACGYIGSHTLIDLIEQGFEVISLDSLSRSTLDQLQRVQAITGVEIPHYTVDLADKKSLEALYPSLHDVAAVIHFAAYKTVPESVKNPLLYYHNNLNSTQHVIELCLEFGIEYLVFSSSCSVYGNAPEIPVTEETPLAKAESPYAHTKQVGEEMIQAVVRSGVKLKSQLLRYFNPAGAHESGRIGEILYAGSQNLVPILCEVAAGKREQLKIFGQDYLTRDGTCVRDYIHVMDIAHAHSLAVKYMLEGKQTNGVEVLNLGTGQGITVWESVQAFMMANELTIPYQFVPRREGDVAAIYANNEKARKILGWEAKRSLFDIMTTAWRWQQTTL